MTFTTADLLRLRWALLLLVSLAAAGAGAAYYAKRQAEDADKTFKVMISQRQEIQAKLARANDEAADIRARIGTYRSLADRGLIGLERRLEWVEHIAQIKNARRLIDIQYELAPQRPVDAAVLPSGSLAGGHEFLTSTMTLQMQLLHEDDLLGFINDLATSVQAFLHVRGCRVERIPRGTQERGPSAQLKAECTIDWITLREKK